METSNLENLTVEELAQKYISIWDCCDSEAHGKAVSEGLRASYAITNALKEKEIDKKWFSVACDPTLSVEENYNELLKHYDNTVLVENKDLCMSFIKLRLSSKDVQTAKLKAKTALARKLANKDPMLVKFIEYKIRIKKARDALAKHLVNETPETLDEKYKDIAELIK